MDTPATGKPCRRGSERAGDPAARDRSEGVGLLWVSSKVQPQRKPKNQIFMETNMSPPTPTSKHTDLKDTINFSPTNQRLEGCHRNYLNMSNQPTIWESRRSPDSRIVFHAKHLIISTVITKRTRKSSAQARENPKQTTCCIFSANAAHVWQMLHIFRQCCILFANAA